MGWHIRAGLFFLALLEGKSTTNALLALAPRQNPSSITE